MKHFQIANSSEGMEKALAQLSCIDFEHTLFCLEHKELYCWPFLKFSIEQEWKVWLESAWKVRSIRHPRQKSDATCSARIADYSTRNHGKARLWVPDQQAIVELRELLVARDRLIQIKHKLEVPIKEAKAMGNETVYNIQLSASREIISVTKNQIKEIERKIDQTLVDTPDLETNFALVCSIPGVGRYTGLFLILATHNFTKFENARRLACYCGVAPFPYSSGSSIKGRNKVSHYANKKPKQMLHMAAMSSIRFNPDLNAYYHRRCEEGKHKMLLLNNIRNKLLHTVFAVVKRRTPWKPKFSGTEENLG